MIYEVSESRASLGRSIFWDKGLTKSQGQEAIDTLKMGGGGPPNPFLWAGRITARGQKTATLPHLKEFNGALVGEQLKVGQIVLPTFKAILHFEITKIVRLHQLNCIGDGVVTS